MPTPFSPILLTDTLRNWREKINDLGVQYDAVLSEFLTSNTSQGISATKNFYGNVRLDFHNGSFIAFGTVNYGYYQVGGTGPWVAVTHLAAQTADFYTLNVVKANADGSGATLTAPVVSNDVTLYRDSANVLKTDDAMHVNSLVSQSTVSGTAATFTTLNTSGAATVNSLSTGTLSASGASTLAAISGTTLTLSGAANITGAITGASLNVGGGGITAGTVTLTGSLVASTASGTFNSLIVGTSINTSTFTASSISSTTSSLGTASASSLSSSTASISVLSAGSIGIGTASPTHSIHLASGTGIRFPDSTVQTTAFGGSTLLPRVAGSLVTTTATGPVTLSITNSSSVGVHSMKKTSTVGVYRVYVHENWNDENCIVNATYNHSGNGTLAELVISADFVATDVPGYACIEFRLRDANSGVLRDRGSVFFSLISVHNYTL